MQTYDQLLEDISKYRLETCLKPFQLRDGMQYANGCGAKGGTKFPDTMYFILVVAACIIHDIEWELSESYKELLEANERFDNNLKKICDQESMNDVTRWLRRSRIQKYVSGVELYGTESYAIERGFI